MELERLEGMLGDEHLLDKYIGIVRQKWTVQGCLIAVCNICEHNSRASRLRQAWKEDTAAHTEEPSGGCCSSDFNENS